MTGVNSGIQSQKAEQHVHRECASSQMGIRFLSTNATFDVYSDREVVEQLHDSNAHHNSFKRQRAKIRLEDLA